VNKAEQTKFTNALITYFIAVYTRVHDVPPLINRYKEKWGFADMLEDLGFEGGKNVIDYYLGLQMVDHTTIHLFRNYERYARAISERAADEERRAELRKETELRVAEWRASHGSNGTDST
jgi:hypothetical protein